MMPKKLDCFHKLTSDRRHQFEFCEITLAVSEWPLVVQSLVNRRSSNRAFATDFDPMADHLHHR